MAGIGNHIVTQEPIGKVKISSMFVNDLQLNDSMDGLGNDPSDPFNQQINLTSIGKNQDDSNDSMDVNDNPAMDLGGDEHEPWRLTNAKPPYSYSTLIAQVNTVAR